MSSRLSTYVRYALEYSKRNRFSRITSFANIPKRRRFSAMSAGLGKKSDILFKKQRNLSDAFVSRLKHEISLRAHLKRYHDASFEAVNCPICSKEVPSKHSLAGHIRSVHGEREHSCSFCSKAFKTAKKLKVCDRSSKYN